MRLFILTDLGAAIGGVAGAVGGAIISKKKGLGAVVGGVVGAAGGYIIGKGMDKKGNQLVIQ
jgi:outer membrane lipoprotein SlyB